MRSIIWTLALLGAAASHAQAQVRSMDAPPSADADVSLIRRGEPGTALELHVRFVDPATGRPVPGAGVYTYQTDASGHYAADAARADDRARIFGYARAGDDGVVTLRSVVPGTYPGTNAPKHVHLVVRHQGYAERIFEVVFDDDANVVARIRSDSARPFSPYELCTPTVTEAGYVCRVDAELRRVPDSQPRGPG